ncbi:hypothetical protein PL18_02540 [Vibrio renipiscarius]|uniref:Integrase n=2 Tax=Vibrio renipiscarius TaxID=1461322 RepID=A0A0C2NIA3_9VIBR|nr:hypothetical protein OJ16_08845 [Vibrio renipiscarius]KII81466.1 hypothetical protein PL18_02540 [Vibrio renipiscarius]
MLIWGNSMTKMEFELNQALHLFLRTGGKKNRRNQAEKMRSFCREIQKQDPKISSLGQIGRKQVNEFWRRNNHLAPSTKLAYYYAINHIWQNILRRASSPPKSDN